MAEIKQASLSEVYLLDRRGTIVKHFKRDDVKVTMCGKEVEAKIAPAAINRLCVICDRWRRDFEERQAVELKLFEAWMRSAMGQDVAAAGGTFCLSSEAVGCVFGSVVEGPNDEK